ncbi:MAG: HAD family phosphatase [Bdellovibrionales bacterium]|nr:HAD family phosphatase [Bdellovibrionales bacterium]
MQKESNTVLPLDKFAAFLFDLDGTLADSMGLHNRAWIQTLNEMGLIMTEEILLEYVGISNVRQLIFLIGALLDPGSSECCPGQKKIGFLQTLIK